MEVHCSGASDDDPRDCVQNPESCACLHKHPDGEFLFCPLSNDGGSGSWIGELDDDDEVP